MSSQGAALAFLEFIFSVYKVGSQTRLSIDLGVKEMSEARLHKCESNLVMPSEMRQQIVEGH